MTMAVALIFAVIAAACSTERKKVKRSAEEDKSIIINTVEYSNAEENTYLYTDDPVETGSGEDDFYSKKREEILEKLKRVEGKSLRKDTGYIFVGDSRFVNMNTACGISKSDNLFMVAKIGEGYSWFKNTALQQIKRITASGLFKNWKVIICLGINDLEDISKYTAKYEELKDDYDLILVSVNPVDHYSNLSNQKIENFNASLMELDIPYIDTFTILCETGYSTADGLHYNTDTSKKIYNGILSGLLDLDPDSFKEVGTGLDKASLSKKNSIQNDITAQNKYVPKTDESEEGTDSEEEMRKLLETIGVNPTEDTSGMSTEGAATDESSTEGISTEVISTEGVSSEVTPTEGLPTQEQPTEQPPI